MQKLISKQYFIDNKYTKWYFSIINNAKAKNRKKGLGVYFESHHIIPKCKPFLGSNKTENKVLLTAKEHFICHLLLTRMCDGHKRHKMVWALHRFSFSAPSKNRQITSAQYELVRQKFSKHISENHPSRDPEIRKQISERVTEDWKNNEKRRQKVSETFSVSHKKRKKENSQSYYETQTKNAQRGATAVKKKWQEDAEWANYQKEQLSKRTSGKNNPMYGKKIEGKHKEKLSKATSRKRWMYNDSETVYIDVDLVEIYEQKGYKPGRNNYKRKEDR